MKKTVYFAVLVCFIVASFIHISGAFAKSKKSKTSKLTQGEESGIMLLALEKKGYIEINDPGPAILIYVEPKFWKAGTHADKKDLCAHAYYFIEALDAKKQLKEQHVCISFYDMTSKEKLANVEMGTGKIDIYK